MKDTDFTEVEAAQIAAMTAALPMVHVETYDLTALPEAIQGAGILLETVGFRVDEKAKGHGDILWLDTEFHAHCFMTRAQPNVTVEVKNLAALVLKVVNKNRWGQANIQLPNSLDAMPSKFKLGKGGFESWVATWRQTVAVGDTWQSKSLVPETILLGQAPNIGPGHEDHYEVLSDGTSLPNPA